MIIVFLIKFTISIREILITIKINTIEVYNINKKQTCEQKIKERKLFLITLID